MTFILPSLCVLFLQGLLVSYNFNMAVGDTFHIVTSLETPCPGEFSGVPCLTLQQYVSNPSISSDNVTLLFETGNHTLRSVFYASAAMKYSLSGDNVNINCILDTAQLHFLSIQDVYMSGINFWRCGGMRFANSALVTIINSIFNHSGGISFSIGALVTISNNTFNHITGGISFSNFVIATVTYNIFDHISGGISFSNGEMVTLNNSRVHYGISTRVSTRIPPISLSHVGVCNTHDSSFCHNRNNGGYGGVLKITNSTINIYDSVFQNNTANYGGVIYATGVYARSYTRITNITLVNSTFMDNRAEARYGSSGGVLYVTENQHYQYPYGYPSKVVLIIHNCSFNSNTASSGGVLYHSGSQDVYIMNSIFDNAQSGYGSYGGAIYSTATLILELNSFTNYRLYGSGGAVYSTSPIKAIQNKFFNNLSYRSGGAIYSTSTISVTQCNFSHNYGGLGGGAIYSTSAVSVTQCNFSHNSAGWQGGGAIYSMSKVTVMWSSFSYNTGQQHGGASYSAFGLHCVNCTFMSNSAVDGGAVFTNSTSVFDTCDFINNTASSYGGGVYLSGTNSSLSVLQSSFTSNTAATLGGGAIYSNSRYSNIIISECTFSYNSASYCSVLDVDEFYHFNISISDSIFTYNIATGRLLGGGVACIRNASTHILRSIFQHNQAALHGGVFYIDECNLFVDESLFVNNSAFADGGVFYTYVHPSYYNIRRSEFSYNSAGDDGGVMFIGRVNSQVNISECIFSFNNASDRGGVAALIGSSMFLELNRTDLYNNTAEFGGIISSCNSVVMVMEDALFLTTDPVYSFCILYDGHIVHYHIPPPVNTQLTLSPFTTVQIMSMASSLGTRISTTQQQNHVTSRAILRTSELSTKFTTRLYLTHTTVLSTAISTTEINKLTLSPIVALSNTLTHPSVTVIPTKSFLFSSQERKLSSTTSGGMPSANYLTMLKPEATTSNSPYSLTVSNSVLNTYLGLSPSLSETVTSLATIKTEKLPTTSQSRFTNSMYTEFSVKASLTTPNTDGTHSYSDTISSSKMTKQLVKPTQTVKSSIQPFLIVYQNTLIPPINKETDKGSVISDLNIKFNVLMAVFLTAIIAIVVMLAGIIVKLYKMRPVKPVAISTCNEEENPLFECESTETEMKDNLY